jgi:hypothetical protein
MSNMKTVSLVAAESRRVQAMNEMELHAVTLDLYAALEPIRAQLKGLEAAIRLTNEMVQRHIDDTCKTLSQLLTDVEDLKRRKNDGIKALIQRVRLAHDAGAGFHLSEEEMTALLDAASGY